PFCRARFLRLYLRAPADELSSGPWDLVVQSQCLKSAAVHGHTFFRQPTLNHMRELPDRSRRKLLLLWKAPNLKQSTKHRTNTRLCVKLQSRSCQNVKEHAQDSGMCGT